MVSPLSARIRAVARAKTLKFTELVRISGLDPASDFRYMDLRNFDFSQCDLTGFDFTGSIIEAASFSNAAIKNTVFDLDQLLLIENDRVRSSLDLQLLKACSAGDRAKAENCLDHGAKVDVNYRGYTPLIICAANDNVNMIEMLLSYGANINGIASQSGNTSLIAASKRGSINALHSLIDKGAAVDISNPETGTTALIEASAEGWA